MGGQGVQATSVEDSGCSCSAASLAPRGEVQKETDARSWASCWDLAVLACLKGDCHASVATGGWAVADDGGSCRAGRLPLDFDETELARTGDGRFDVVSRALVAHIARDIAEPSLGVPHHFRGAALGSVGFVRDGVRLRRQGAQQALEEPGRYDKRAPPRTTRGRGEVFRSCSSSAMGNGSRAASSPTPWRARAEVGRASTRPAACPARRSNLFRSKAASRRKSSARAGYEDAEGNELWRHDVIDSDADFEILQDPSHRC